MTDKPFSRRTGIKTVAPASAGARSTGSSMRFKVEHERRERQISALYELWRALPQTESSRLLQMVAERATVTMDAHTCSLLLRERGGDTLRVAAQVGLPADVAESVTMLVGEKIAGRVAASGQAILVNKDPRQHPVLREGGSAPDITPRPDVESALCAPLVAMDGGIVGVLCLSRHTPALPFTEGDLRMFSLFAAQAGAVITQTRTVDDLIRAGAETAKMEREVERTAGLAALGQLAASVAHELRNPLSSIKGAAQFLLAEFEDESAPVTSEQIATLRDFLGIVVDEVNGLGTLTTDLLEFARPTPPERTRRDLREIVQHEIGFLTPELLRLGVTRVDEVIALTNPASVEADGAQIGGVLRNLLLNAAQAMTTASGVSSNNIITVTLQRSTDNEQPVYAIVVEDNGPGIPAPLLAHLWEPFFTTKARGTGLGLAQVKRTIVAHGGTVHVENIRGGGARFRFTLPALDVLREPRLPSAIFPSVTALSGVAPINGYHS